ncbi:MAG TPA: hypothetical protein VEL12_04115 [Candidatus Nitrosopolaris sp.]|nr:hypothetical protein [Candidatus Nitrosopolaris sp.]
MSAGSKYGISAASALITSRTTAGVLSATIAGDCEPCLTARVLLMPTLVLDRAISGVSLVGTGLTISGLCPRISASEFEWCLPLTRRSQPPHLDPSADAHDLGDVRMQPSQRVVDSSRRRRHG